MTLRYKTLVPTVLELLAPPIYARKTNQNQFSPEGNRLRLRLSSLLAPGLGHASPSGRSHINTGLASQSSSRFHTVHLV